MKYEVNTGYHLNGLDSARLDTGEYLVPEIYILRVPGGNIYYRDILIMDEKVRRLTSTATFVPDDQTNDQKE